jgi:hypothetical protein
VSGPMGGRGEGEEKWQELILCFWGGEKWVDRERGGMMQPTQSRANGCYSVHR